MINSEVNNISMNPQNFFKILFEGPGRKICELIKNGKSTIRPFIEDLEASERNSLLRLIEELGKRDMKNTEKFRHEGDGIFAIKSGQIRIYCFFDSGNLMLLTNGLKKKQNRVRREDVEKACNLRDYYMQQRSGKHEQ